MVNFLAGVRDTKCVTRLSAGGGALPVIMSIIGPRETHDYRNYNLLGPGTNKFQKIPKPNHIFSDTLQMNERAAGKETNGKIVLYTTSGGGIAETNNQK